MDRYYGFDLGDAESAVSRLEKDSQDLPEVLEVRDAKSFITAYAQMASGELLIGESACYTPKAVNREIRFKSRFLSDPESHKSIRRFAAGVLGELYGSGALIKNDESCFYIGCPAGWDRTAREEYRSIFEDIGYPPARIISESRAALVSACRSKHLQVGYDILSKPVLVVDIGSSTTDFAYIAGGKEVELKTAGEVVLGGGIMDEILLDEAIDKASKPDRIRKIFSESTAWLTYAEFAARRLKEKYFTDEEYWKDHACTESVSIHYSGLPVRLKLEMDEKTADRLVSKKIARLGGRSFREVFCESLGEVRDKIEGGAPELVFLTGGVSKMPVIRTWVREAFPDSVVILGHEPEFSVSRGLAYCGRIDDDLRAFKSDLNTLIESTKVEEIVQAHITDLYRDTVDTLVDPILEKAAMPVFERWRNGEIRKLSDVDGELEEAIQAYLQTDEARALLVEPITNWLKPVSTELEEYTIPICVNHNVPYKTLSLNSYLALSDLEVKVEAKDIFAVEEITWTIDTLISVLVGLICGGSGVALVASGAPGIIAGAFISLIVLFLGKDRMEKALLTIDIPNVARKLVRKGAMESRMKSISQEIRSNFYRTLEEEKNEIITDRLIDDISSQIELCLTRMAEVVEVPLG